MKRHLFDIWGDNSAAVAPTVALSLFALIGAGGIAFDYARMASLDTELQNAADQAALAAATQLDQETGAIARAIAAAQGLLANQALFANDGNADGTSVSVPTIVFYSNKSDAEADNGTNCPTGGVVTADIDARFVCVRTSNRAARFALTPIVAAFSSGDFSAMAVAGLGSAICKMPPLMLCNPYEPDENTDTEFPFDANALKGVGIRLVGDGSYEPGNWGFLQNNGSGANVLLKALGYNSPPGDCIETTGVDTQTGVDASVMDGVNTRFDIDANGNSCPGGNSNCSPSLNVRKDVLRGDACGITGQGWEETDANGANYAARRYRPSTDAVLGEPAGANERVMGHPRDLCHAWSYDGNCTGSANGRLGDGQWDINAYWNANFGANYAGEVSAATYGSQPQGYPTRYQVYQWEMDNYATQLGTKTVGSKTAYGTPVASKCLATPTAPYGLVPGGSVVDRRRISAAVVNCKAYNVGGHEDDLPVLKWIDLFIVEPSLTRRKCTNGPGCNTKYTEKTDIYVEMIGETNLGGAGPTAGQVVRRDVPYLVK